jgi:hypothetical protein
MAILTLFIPLTIEESKAETQNIRDRYDRIETKRKKFDQVAGIDTLNSRHNVVMGQLDEYLSRETPLNQNGGYQVVSVTPVLETQTEKVDKDEPMLPLVTTTGFLVILHKA